MEPVEISRHIIQALEQAWNAADGAAFGNPFTNDADFVDITGALHQNQPGEAIGQAHQGLFNSIYKDSHIQYELVQANQIDQNTIVANARAALDAPGGPLAGKSNSTITLVLTQANGDWRIRAFHNTLVRSR